MAVKPGEAADDRRIVRITPVTVKFQKVSENTVDVIQGIGTIRMAGKLNALPGGQGIVNVLFRLRDFPLQGVQFVIDPHVAGRTEGFPFGELRLQFDNRFFKLKHNFSHCFFSGVVL